MKLPNVVNKKLARKQYIAGQHVLQCTSLIIIVTIVNTPMFISFNETLLNLDENPAS